MIENITKEWKTKTGLVARVIQHPLLYHFCGYVGLDKGSGFYELDYAKIENRIDVHGGVTFTGTFKDSALWWIGYDCAHSCDFSKYNPSGVKRDLNFCVDECEYLAKQIFQTPIDYYFLAKRIGRLPEDLHNKMIAWAIENPNDEIIKEYFENYGMPLL
jgi:hypothetical protein